MSELLEIAQRIKDKRQALGISREQLADQTRVPLTFIIALEEERHEELPEAVYSNGFVRIISKHLDIEASTLTATKINLQTNMASDLFQARKRKRLSLPTKRHTYRLISASLFLLPIAASIVILVFGGNSWFVSTPKPPIASLEDTSVEVKADNTSADEDTTESAVTQEQQVQLTVHVPTEVQITVDGEQLTNEILLPRVHVFKFKEESEFIISDTSAMTVSFNGETISNLKRLGKRRTLVFRSTQPEHANY